MVELLRQFEHIGIRESTGKELLREIGVDSVQVLDPVLLFKDYHELVGDVSMSNEIVLFKIKKSNAFYDKAREIGKLSGLTVRSIGSLRREKGIKGAYPEGIENWVKRLMTARYILTDSFHGLVISLLYHRQFVILPGVPGRVTRLRSLLQLVGLEERIMDINDSKEKIYAMLQKPIDYKHVDSVLERERKNSFDYLRRFL